MGLAASIMFRERVGAGKAEASAGVIIVQIYWSISLSLLGFYLYIFLVKCKVLSLVETLLVKTCFSHDGPVTATVAEARRCFTRARWHRMIGEER